MGTHGRSGFAEVNGTCLYYEIAGDGDPLVLIHGFSLDTRLWDDQVQPFARRYQVIRYDLRGFGRAAPPDHPYAHADDLGALLEHLGVARAHVVGLSLGGTVALDFALAYPAATQQLVLIDSGLAGFRTRDKQTRSVLKPVFTKGREAGVEAAKQLWLESPLFAPAREQPAVYERLVAMVTDYSGWHFINREPTREPAPPAARRLAEIRAPTLVIVGERDVAAMRAIAGTLADEIPNAREVVLPGVGHLANLEAPAAVNSLVLGFLKS